MAQTSVARYHSQHKYEYIIILGMLWKNELLTQQHKFLISIHARTPHVAHIPIIHFLHASTRCTPPSPPSVRWKRGARALSARAHTKNCMREIMRTNLILFGRGARHQQYVPSAFALVCCESGDFHILPGRRQRRPKYVHRPTLIGVRWCSVMRIKHGQRSPRAAHLQPLHSQPSHQTTRAYRRASILNSLTFYPHAPVCVARSNTRETSSSLASSSVVDFPGRTAAKGWTWTLFDVGDADSKVAAQTSKLYVSVCAPAYRTQGAMLSVECFYDVSLCAQVMIMRGAATPGWEI